ncbi:MAG: acyl-CoA thioesterase [Chitinophagaceae bacterium]|nr:acyl-CoA thioesterase [Chitinophagaceae bacterium]
MSQFSMPVQVRWSDLDPNFHLRHSVYYDWAAMCRMNYLTIHGLTPAVMQQHRFGPIIFREECVFYKEIKYGDAVTINMNLLKGKKDYSRWTIQHEIKKQEDILCAKVSIDGAWLNIVERKLFIPPAEVVTVFSQMPLSEGFEWTE